MFCHFASQTGHGVCENGPNGVKYVLPDARSPHSPCSEPGLQKRRAKTADEERANSPHLPLICQGPRARTEAMDGPLGLGSRSGALNLLPIYRPSSPWWDGVNSASLATRERKALKAYFYARLQEALFGFLLVNAASSCGFPAIESDKAKRKWFESGSDTLRLATEPN